MRRGKVITVGVLLVGIGLTGCSAWPRRLTLAVSVAIALTVRLIASSDVMRRSPLPGASFGYPATGNARRLQIPLALETL